MNTARDALRMAAALDPPLGGLSAEEFLREYWQRQPLLIRGAIRGFDNPISADELAGLACEQGIRSRIVCGHPDRRDWSVEYGPFDPERFAQLPETAWTLLVSEVEHYWPEGPEWLRRFDFIPRWRRDDLMISYAARDGSVGPHIDAYDVFLFQAQGQRRWQIQEPPPKSPICLPALPLAILRKFEPTSEWVLEPGDMLYLPPGVPHLGMSLDDDCMTWSIGFRAPAWRDLVGAFLEDRLASVGPERVGDAGRTAAMHAHELAADDLAALRSGLLERLRLDTAELDRFLAGFLSRSEHESPSGDESDMIEEAGPPDKLDTATRYRFDPDLKRYWIQSDAEIVLFVAGQSLSAPDFPPALADAFCAADTIVPDEWISALPELVPVLEDLLTRDLLEPDQ